MEKTELEHPSARKILPDRTIYLSQPMPITYGPLMICDFGAARIGERYTGDVMPGVYRVPEIIMGMEWDSKIDIWSVGVMVCKSNASIAIWCADAIWLCRSGICLKGVGFFVP
jgi:serine/threonine protein kinase